MTASGIDAQLGFGEESTYGTRVTPTRFYEFLDESVKLTVERVESKGLRAGRRVQHNWAAGIKKVDGSINMEVAPQGSGLLLKHIFGGITTTGAGPYTHTASPGTLDGLSLTAQIGRPMIDGTVQPFDYTGLKITAGEFAASVGEFLTLQLDVYGQAEATDQTLATAAYPSGWMPFVFTEGSITIAGSEYCVTEFSLGFDNGLAVDRHFMCASAGGAPKEPVESEMREYTGSFSGDFDSLTNYNRFVNGTEAALVLTFTSGANSLTITMNVRFDGETPNVSGPEVLSQSLSYKAVSDTDDATAITAVLVNSDSAA